MHVPIQVDYGVRALIDLAENSLEGDIQASDIAKRQSETRPAVFTSRLPVGSSANNKEGLFDNATPIATFCCSPPERSFG